MALSPKQFLNYSRAFRSFIVGTALTILSLSHIVNAQIFQVSAVQAITGSDVLYILTDGYFGNADTFADVFENCSDSEQEWIDIKACLNNESNLEEMTETARNRWNNVIKSRFEAFFDNHGTAGPGIDLPADLLSNPYVYGTTAVDPVLQDQRIKALLSEAYRDADGEKGLDGLQTIGEVFDNYTAKSVMCSLLDVLPGQSDNNTNALPVPYAGLVKYGPDGDGDSPLCTQHEVLADKPYLIKGLPVTLLYTLADIMGSTAYNAMGTQELSTLRSLLTDLKTFLTNPPAEALRTAGYVDLGVFYVQHQDLFAVIPGDGPIEALFKLCQTRTSENPLATYVSRLNTCYKQSIFTDYTAATPTQVLSSPGDSSHPLTARALEFVRDVILPAMNQVQMLYAGYDTRGQTILRTFLRSSGYTDLAEGYDPLADLRQSFTMEDYLNQTLGDVYLSRDLNIPAHQLQSVTSDSGGGSHDASQEFDVTITWPVAAYLTSINDQLVSDQLYVKYLDRSVSIAPAQNTTGNLTTLRQLLTNVQQQSKRNVLQQMNSYLRRTVLAAQAKPALLKLWYYFVASDHDPSYNGSIVHTTGDLDLLVEEKDATGISSIFTDPFLARVTNACSPNPILDSISRDRMPAFKRCLEYEADYVDHSDLSGTAAAPKHFRLSIDEGASVFDVHVMGTILPAAEPLSIQRSEPARRGMHAIIDAVAACLANLSCQSVDDQTLGRQEGNATAQLPDDGTHGTGNALINTLLGWINVFLGIIIKFFFWLCTLVMSLFQAALGYSGFTTSDFVVTMWKAIRDFVNLFFIIALLGIAIANIVQYEINNYAIKTILPKLIVIVIAVNFSRLFVGVVVDATNVVEAGVYQIAGIGPHGAGGTQACTQYIPTSNQASGGWTMVKIPDDVKQGSLLCRLAQGLKFEEMQRAVKINNPSQLGNQIDFFLSNVALLLMVIMIFFGFLALAMTFTIRIVVLWALAITSPLYVVSKLSPLTQSIGGQWQSKFFKYATMHVGVAFFMTLAVLAADSVIPQIFSGALQTTGSIAGAQLGPSGFNSLADYLKLVFIVAMIYAGVFTAAKGDYAQGFIDKVAGFGNPSNVWGVTRKGLGLGYNISQAAGNRLRDVKTSKWNPIGIGARTLGRVLSAPSNIVGGGKAIVADLKKSADERQTRFSLQAANAMSFGSMSDRFRGQILANENKIVSEQKEDMKLRFTVKQIEGKLADAKSSGDGLRLKAATLALAEKGALHWTPAERESMRQAEARRTTQEQADNFIDNIESTNVSARDRRYQEMAGVVARSGDKKEIDRRLMKAWNDGDQAAVIGLLLASNQTGRIEDANGSGFSGHALALARLLELRQKGLQIDEDTYRLMGKTIGKESIAAYGTQFKDARQADGFTDQLAAVAVEHDALLRGSASTFAKFAGKTFAQIAQSASESELKSFITLMGQLGGTATAGGHMLTETTAGAKLATDMAGLQRQIWGINLVPEGDDASAGTMTQFLEAPSIAETFRMGDTGQFLLGTSKIKMMQGFMSGLMKNADASPNNMTQLNAVLANIQPMISNAAQKQTMKTLLETIEKSDPAFVSNPALARRIADIKARLT